MKKIAFYIQPKLGESFQSAGFQEILQINEHSVIKGFKFADVYAVAVNSEDDMTECEM